MSVAGEHDDRGEHEADEIAGRALDEVVPEWPRVPRTAAPAVGGDRALPPIVDETIRHPGEPLDEATRRDLEPRFGVDLSTVRVHRDEAAGASARAVDAIAYTVGRDVVFGDGIYAPWTSTGRRLLAHELGHVVQQRAVRPARPGQSVGARDGIGEPAGVHSRPVLQRRRRVRNVRYLASGEESVARVVFKGRIPYADIVISDGLGFGDRPFTLPTSVPATFWFNVNDGKYVIHAGENGYFGLSGSLEDRKLLIHELTHVWQGEHSSHSWDYVVESAWNQALSDDAYAYDHQHLLPWGNYGPEQQAQIVEDWYADGMREAESEDRRFYYIVKYIRGERVDHDWIAAQDVITPLPAGTLDVAGMAEASRAGIEAEIVRLLLLPFPEDDPRALERASKVVDLFRRLTPYWSERYRERIAARRPGDRLVELLFSRVSRVTRARILVLLEPRAQ
jgi:hypothetical protein